MKTLFLEEKFVNGFNAVAYHVKFDDKPNFNLNIGEPTIYTPLFGDPEILSLNLGYLMVIDEHLLQLINIFSKNLRYGDNTEYTPEQQLTMNYIEEMNITLSSNELIFIYVQNCKTTYDIINQETDEIEITIDYPITSVHLNLFGECKVKKLFQIINDNTKKYNIIPLKKISQIDFNFNITYIYDGDFLSNFRPPYAPDPYPNFPSITSSQPNAIVYLIKLLEKIHIKVPPFLLKQFVSNFQSAIIKPINT